MAKMKAKRVLTGRILERKRRGKPRIKLIADREKEPKKDGDKLMEKNNSR